MSFIENTSKFKGAAIYISSLRRCVWMEEPPFHDRQKALRWCSNFVYKNNSLDGGVQTFTGSKYDIATDTEGYRSTTDNNSPVKVTGVVYSYLFFPFSFVPLFICQFVYFVHLSICPCMCSYIQVFLLLSLFSFTDFPFIPLSVCL